MAEAKKKIRAKELVEDVRSGLTDSEIQEKHGLTMQQMQQVFSQLLQMGALTQFDLEQRPPKPEEKQEILTKCPACGKPYNEELAQCPECGLAKDTGTAPPIARIPLMSMPPARPATPVGFIVAVVFVLVALLGGVGAYFWVSASPQPRAAAPEPSKKHFLSAQELAEAYADQNELTGIVAMGSFDEVKTAAGKPDFYFHVDAPDIDGRTVLMVAVENGRRDVAELLLYYGANMYADDAEGNTPAILAAKKGLADVVKLFVRKGYDVDYNNKKGESVRSLAHDKADKKLLEIVLEGTKMPGDRKTLRENELARLLESRNAFCERLCVTHASPQICSENCMKYYGIQR